MQTQESKANALAPLSRSCLAISSAQVNTLQVSNAKACRKRSARITQCTARYPIVCLVISNVPVHANSCMR